MPRKKTTKYGIVAAPTVPETTNGAPHEAEPVDDSENLIEGTGTATNSEQTGDATLLDQAEAVRTSLRGSLDQVGNLVLALKRDRKKSRLVESTLSSLRQLQKLDV